mmetsp:Transcript_61449/g.73004  ORF Transcript_61449/g.73004 Transcript_61449/m.73004 type:complete len:500 (-) Transcript_61449:263-1762(-)|eukprot:CAMPEP_0172498554 /NCGR_PEP_ID=MMETSP1066-20121228/113645_1 /TAXON_ID=671091 /ORGANISM="Coscinodiscus wailesii, Strain CCMP2513" /LENGTH=499 /DNA_ID=CAMNT_0013271861 /DNA_START=177 /DNA_END=1676 /DNA_ORIENTATION=+
MTIPVVTGTVVQGTDVKKTPLASNEGVQYDAPATGGYNPPVPIPVKSATATNIEDSGGEFDGNKGQVQPRRFRDVGFAVAFVIHILVVLALLVVYGDGMQYVGGDGGGGNSGTASLVTVVVVCGLFSFGVSIVSLGVMMKFATQLVKMALIFSVAMSGVVAVLGFMSGQLMMAILGALSFAVGICYAYAVWDRIPFAAANMNTALTGVRSNMGLSFCAYFFIFVAFAWSVLWTLAASGTMSALGQGSLFLFLVSYYWTHQVIQNTVHVTTAGTIGTWWFAPEEASTCCSAGLKDSFVRATTYSFGSICFGSLIVALVQALRQLNHMARDQEDCGILVCIIDCILACIESVIEYFNKWAYVYVGLYGYSYMEAGKNVITLFENKGWTTIITDNLVDNVLAMMSLAIGLVSGLIGLIVAEIDKANFQELGYESPGSVGFIIGLLVGFVLGSILMGVVGSAVNTVIVCFAEAPNEFAANHPALSDEMRSAWRQAWPTECGNY